MPLIAEGICNGKSPRALSGYAIAFIERGVCVDWEGLPSLQGPRLTSLGDIIQRARELQGQKLSVKNITARLRQEFEEVLGG